jgi:hypothetical protein
MIVVSGCATHGKREPRGVTLAENGAARTRIVVAEKAPPPTRHAAEELQRFLGEIGGAEIPIVSDRTRPHRGDIVLGRNAHQRRYAKDIDFAALGAEGYVLRTQGGRLIIAGGEPRGTMYGAYGLLEDVFGCRWFTPELSRIPKMAALRVPALNETHVPALEYREPFTAECRDADWAARNRVNSSASRLDEQHGGKVTYFGFVHTFESLVPPDRYFDTHPEYFSLVKGKRLRERSQLCTTNEDVVRIVTEEVRKRMREHPEATVFSVSQNDWYNFCECDKCTAMAKAEGSQIAPVLWMVNRVADAIKDEFPDKLIDTLAYQWTRKPPRTMRPAKNVVVRLCSIECCFSHSFEACNSPENQAFVQDVEGWSKRCDRLWVWDYVTSFAHYLTPFPNLRVRDDNIRFFAKHNVTGIFEQDVYTTENGELSGLSGYLGAKLLWDPDYDENTAVNEYLEGVYGAAAEPIRRYIDLLHDHVEKENLHVMIWAGPSDPYLNESLLAKADALWDEAERSVSGAPDVLARVQTARLSVDYAIIERARQRGDRPYKIDHAHFTVTPQPEFQQRAERFFAVGEQSHVESLRESSQTLADYRQLILPMTQAVTLAPRAAVRPGKLRAGLRFDYYEGAFNELPDFALLKPVASGAAKIVSLDSARARDTMALQFKGFIKVPADGVYTFGTRSNDGSRVYIGDILVVDNGGRHTTRGQTGFAALRKGYHAVRVTYFQAGSASDLEFFYSGPGIEHQVVPSSALWRRP